MRIGMGYDVHKLVEGRELILGGVKIPYEKGLLGHSDADVLLHAIMDALLGAAALGDIGKHFPDTDPAYKGASSIRLLEHVGELIEKELYVIGNIDATIIAQRPKMAPHIETMRKNVAEALHIDVSQINIKATTEEGLGFTGSGEGISAQAIAALDTISNYSYTVIRTEPATPARDANRLTDKESRSKGWRSGNLKNWNAQTPGRFMRPCFQRIAGHLWITTTQRKQRIIRFIP